MKFYSTDFKDGGEIPKKFTCSGEGVRPNLIWSDVPAEAKSLAISIDDPDAPNGNYNHWRVINIPIASSGVTADENLSGKELVNSSGQTSYVPPCPPCGKHRYIFSLFALDREYLELENEIFKGFLDLVESHSINQAMLTGFYGQS